MPPVDLQQLQAAIEQRAWPVVAAFVIGLLVWLAKTPALGGVWDRVPKAYRFIIPIALGVLSGASEALLRGTSWPVALIFGLFSGLAPIGGDKVLTQSVPELVSKPDTKT
jgi:hypothetical protein